MSITITRTKVLPPRRRSDLVSRRRLLDLLDDLLEQTLTLIVAPAGYGKTTLLVDATEQIERPICWYTLDPLDCDIQRFIAHLIAAIQVQFPNFGEQAMAILHGGTGDDDHLDQLLTTIVNEAYDVIREHFVLVLDDYHFVNQSKQINYFVNHFIRQVDEQCHVVIASRSLLSLPDLPLLVARGEVGGLGLKELVFQPQEIQTLIQQNYQQTVTGSVAEELAAETEGWITGLLLSAQSTWQGMIDRQRLARVSGVDLYDYLAQQVLEQQPERVQSFLLHTSLLEEFDRALCETVLAPIGGYDDVNELLTHLSQHNLFVQPVGDDGAWLRYHNLFQEFLQSHLEETRPDERERILRRLGAVYLEQEAWEKAHDTFVRLGDPEATADMIEAAGRPLVRGGRLKMLGEWIDVLPSELVESRPALLSLRGAVASMLGDPEQGIDLLSRSAVLARERDDTDSLAQALVWRASAQRFVASYDTSLADADKALSLSEQTPDLRSIRAEALRAKGITLAMMGRWNDATEWLSQSLHAYRTLGEDHNVAILQMEIGTIHTYTGCYSDALTHYDEALAYWEQERNIVWQANVLNNLGVLHDLMGNYDRANALLEEALSCAWHSGYTRMEALTLASIGDLYTDLDALEAALAAYREARSTAERSREHSLVGYVDLAIAALRRRKQDLEQARVHLEAAAQITEMSGSVSDRGLYCLERGLVAFQTGDTETAIEHLKTAAQHFDASGQSVECTCTHLHLAHVFRACDDAASTHAHLADAFTLAKDLDSWHPLIPAGREVRDLLVAFRDNDDVGSFARRLLDHITEFEQSLPAMRRNLRRQAEAIPFAPPTIEIRAFGRAQVCLHGEPITGSEWQSQTARDLFFCLLAHPDGMTKEAIGAIFWPEHSPKKLKSIFKKTIYRVRQALDSDTILFENGRYRFNWALDYDFDVEAFQEALTRAEAATDRDDEMDAYRRAVSLYHGPYLHDITENWTWMERERLARAYKEALLRLAELHLDAGETESALTQCHDLLEEDPCFEEAHRLAMQIYAAMGNRAAVARQFKRCRQVLREQIDVPPSPQTEALYRKLIQ